MLFLYLLQMLDAGRWILDERNQKSRTIHPVSRIQELASNLFMEVHMIKWIRPELIELSKRDQAHGDCGFGSAEVPGCASGAGAGDPIDGCRAGGANQYSCLVGQGVQPPCTAGFGAV